MKGLKMPAYEHPSARPKVSRRNIVAGSVTFGTAMVTGAGAAHAAPFRDVPRSNPFYKEVEWMRSRGIARGWPDGTYRPKAPIKRDAFAAFLYRLQGSPHFTPPRISPFRDVTPKTIFYKEITWAKSQGLINGWPDGTFKPFDNVKRDAAVAIFYRLSGSPRISGYAPYRDVPADVIFRDEIGWARNVGLLVGWPDGTFQPFSAITRDAMAALVYRYVNGGVFGKGIRVEGAIAHYYWSRRGLDGYLGKPRGNLRRVTSGVSGKRGYQQDFEGGVVTFAEGIGAFGTRGKFLSQWNAAGGAPGSLGFLKSDIRTISGGQEQHFEGGVRKIVQGWNPPKKYHGPVTRITPVKGGVPLRRGWNGTRVRIVQKKLGIHRSGSSQSYDSATERAVRAFQKRNRLRTTGVVDAKTWAKLAPEYPFTMDAWQTKVAVAPGASRSARIERMIAFAQSCKGSPYTWGGAGWSRHDVAGYDCSGLVLQSLYSAGLDPQPINVVKHAEPTYRTSQMLYSDKKLASFPLSQRKRGDLIFWGDSRGVVRHVAIYLGSNRIIEANVSSYGANVHERPYAAQLSKTRSVKPLVKRPFV